MTPPANVSVAPLSAESIRVYIVEDDRLLRDSLRMLIGGSAGLPEDLAYTIGWALFAIALLVAGLVGRQKAVRVCSIALLALTVCKAFLHDTWRLGGLYRVGSLVGLAVSLALVALVLQKFVFRAGLEEREK